MLITTVNLDVVTQGKDHSSIQPANVLWPAECFFRLLFNSEFFVSIYKLETLPLYQSCRLLLKIRRLGNAGTTFLSC